MLMSPNARPIKVRRLQSLDDVKEFAQGLLAEFDWIPDTGAPAGGSRNADKLRAAPTPLIRPIPQAT